MSAKDKAKELVGKYYDVQSKIEWNVTTEKKEQAELFNDQLGEDVELYWHELAKQSALITIDEMIQWKEALFVTEGSMAYQWLLDVKQEIEKL